jgi:ADP-ribosylglycohydrolase
MLGAIAGDIVGSVYEHHPIKTTDFPLFVPASTFTDDTVLTVAVAYAILHDVDYAATLRQFGRRYPRAGYGGHFLQWLVAEETGPYNSWGNGSAMRVSPVGWAFDDEETVLAQAEASAAVTHNHPEGIKGAQATALAVFLARTGAAKEDIRARIAATFGYDLSRTVEAIHPTYQFDISCQGTVPEAIIAFLDSRDYEDAVRLAVSLGGDSDTLACIAGAIAHAYYGPLPTSILVPTRARLVTDLLDVADDFNQRYGLA